MQDLVRICLIREGGEGGNLRLNLPITALVHLKLSLRVRCSRAALFGEARNLFREVFNSCLLRLLYMKTPLTAASSSKQRCKILWIMRP
jgi:hypothetical protein